MKKQPKQSESDNFKTHIREPRWQQVISVLIVVLAVVGWLLLVAHSR